MRCLSSPPTSRPGPRPPAGWAWVWIFPPARMQSTCKWEQTTSSCIAHDFNTVHTSTRIAHDVHVFVYRVPISQWLSQQTICGGCVFSTFHPSQAVVAYRCCVQPHRCICKSDYPEPGQPRPDLGWGVHVRIKSQRHVDWTGHRLHVGFDAAGA